jgi:hypothetical protein
MWVTRRQVSLGMLIAAVGCGGATEGGGTPPTPDGGGGSGAVGGSAGVGGSGGVGGPAGGGGYAQGGSAGVPGGAAGVGAQAGASGFAGSATSCTYPDYCSCVTNAACKVVSEDCYCPCGVEPCEPNCACECGGGKYLGCAPTSIHNPGAAEGLWLIGWSGGLNHFSWVRLEAGGTLTVNDGSSLFANAPFYPCNGTGTWSMTAKPETIALYLPAGCDMAPITFTSWLGTPAWPKGCLQEASVEALPSGQTLMACRFPLEQCNATLTMCIDPLT